MIEDENSWLGWEKNNVDWLWYYVILNLKKKKKNVGLNVCIMMKSRKVFLIKESLRVVMLFIVNIG